MKHVFRISVLLIPLALAGVSRTAEADVTVPAQLWDTQSMLTVTAGDTNSNGVGSGDYVVGRFAFGFVRAIIPFARTDFAPMSGQIITSATLSFTIGGDSLEPTDLPASSEVRLFSTTVTNIPGGFDPPEADIVAALTGDGGAHTAVGTLSFAPGVAGLMTLDFNAAGLSALETAINGSDPTIGLALREFLPQVDPDDVVAIIRDSPSPTLRVTAVPIPEPTSMALLGIGSLVLLRRRRRMSGA